MSMPPYRVSDLVDAMLASAAMDNQASYLRRGRNYAQGSDDALKTLWIAAFKTWMRLRTDTTQLAVEDLQSELDMRGAATPWEAVPKERAQLYREMAAGNPNDTGLQGAIRDFLDKMNEPQG